MKIAFFGHSFLQNQDSVFLSVEKAILENTCNTDFITFYCGGYGDFDNICASVCRKIKKRLKNTELIFVTPYITESYQERLNFFMKENLFDSIVDPPLEAVPLKFAIIKRNEWMIREADLVITYISHSFGGAYKSMRYAQRKKKRVINLAEQSL